MRNLFLALVLVNLAYAAWTAWFAEPAPPASTPSATGLPIRLVGEVAALPSGPDAVPLARAETPSRSGRETRDEPETTARAASPSGMAEPAEASESTPQPLTVIAPPELSSPDLPELSSSGERCISIGPFADETVAGTASAALSFAGYAPAQRSADGEIWVGFWVHIAAIPSREEANTMLALLRENGLPDAYLIPGEEDGDIISLGVFNNMARAGRLDAQVREIGLVPVIAERSRPAVVQWLDVAVPAGRALDLDALGIRRDRLEQRPCDEAG